jgi:excinuclease ABC subunit C
MIGDKGEVLYVGKAKNLKRRVSAYFSRSHNLRIQRLVSRIRDVQITVTQTEAEALLLENNLIKSLQPRYNVLLKDDKSYPYIYLSEGPFPRLAFHRGARRDPGRYFGPYPSAGAVRETLNFLQRVFPVRQCEDSFFRNRSRPCLQHQIERCAAPCVGLVTEADYAADVCDTVRFLEGHAGQVVDDLADRMERAADALEFETAAAVRDRIATLRRVQERQSVSGERGDLDILACAVSGGRACIQLFVVRGGRNLGNRAFFSRCAQDADESAVISAFIAQHYLEGAVPGEILVSHRPGDHEVLEEVLSGQSGRRVRIRAGVRGERLRWMRLAGDNARAALAARLAGQAGLQERYEALQQALGLDAVPERMECYDISHTRGEKTVASCVVFNRDGPFKAGYRRFNIRDVAGGDDYAAMRQALRRRFTRIQAGEEEGPDLVVIDGGAGQVSAARESLEELGIQGISLVGIAKGPDRRPGMEQLFLSGRSGPFILPAGSPALLLLQQIRDEAHRFAISGHRKSRAKARQRSVLEEIPGVGPKRRAQLLRQFGGLQELSRVGVDDIATVDGISRELAERIYAALHGRL